MNERSRALLAEACGTFWFFFIGAGSILTVAAGPLLGAAVAGALIRYVFAPSPDLKAMPV